MTTRLLALLTLVLSLAAVSSAEAAPKRECMTRQFSDFKVMPAGNARVLYAPGGRRAAAKVAGYVRETYPKFKALLGRVPPSDARERCFHGPNGKLDVYVTSAKKIGSLTVPENVIALVHPYVREETCVPKKPVFAVVRPGVRPLVLAHELYHAFQAAYRTKQKCGMYSEWNEGFATWAGNYAYPSDNIEHNHDGLLKRPDWPMHAWAGGYTGWVFALYLSQRFGPQVIRAVEESREKYPVDVHIDKAIPGGFHERYPDFSVYAYNKAPVPGVPGIESSFAQWDALATAPPVAQEIVSGDHPLPMETLRRLTREYRQVVIANPDLRKIEFHNPSATDPDLHVRALVRRGDGSWTSENWDGRTKVEFCRDQPGQDVREIILAYSNSSLKHTITPDSRIETEKSCSALRFRVLAASVQTQTNASADHILCGRQSGRITFSGSGNAPYEHVTNTIDTAHGLVQGSIGAKTVAGWSGHHLEGCKIGSEGLEPCSADLPPVSPRPDGMWGVSFSVTGGANDAEWTLNWAFDDPSVGGIDAGPDACFVFISGQFDQAVSQRKVPRSTFMQTEPFTLSFEGSGTATSPVIPNAALNHEWRYSITMQRL